MHYRKSKTAKKLVLPAGIVLLVNLILMYAKQANIEIDDGLVWQVALYGYGGLTALLNWLKNRHKGKGTPIKAV